MVVSEVEVKGLAFLNVLDAIGEIRGREFRAQVVQNMPNDGREGLELGIVIASGWYPVRWYRDLFSSAVALAKDATLARELGRTSIRRDVRGVRRLLFKVISVTILQQQGARFFRAYFRPAEASVELPQPRVARIHYKNCIGFDKNIWQEQIGGVEELIAQAGVKSPRVQVISGGGNEASDMTLETKWL